MWWSSAIGGAEACHARPDREGGEGVGHLEVAIRRSDAPPPEEPAGSVAWVISKSLSDVQMPHPWRAAPPGGGVRSRLPVVLRGRRADRAQVEPAPAASQP